MMYYNQSSPIMNNMMYQNNGCNMQSNIVGIGNTGYNQQPMMGGYYNNNYGYYNPYLAAKQREIQQARMREQQRAQSNIMKKISRSISQSLGDDIDEDFLTQRWEQSTQPGFVAMTEDQIETQKTYSLIAMDQNPNSYRNPINERFIAMNNAITEQHNQMIPEDATLYEYMSNGYKLCQEIQQEKIRASQRNLTKLYNSSQYGQLVKMHSNGYFNTVFGGNPTGVGNVNIDDMEVTLPNHMQNEYNDRRKKFLESIFSK